MFEAPPPKDHLNRAKQGIERLAHDWAQVHDEQKLFSEPDPQAFRLLRRIFRSASGGAIVASNVIFTPLPRTIEQWGF
jgi:hypothetical protein